MTILISETIGLRTVDKCHWSKEFFKNCFWKELSANNLNEDRFLVLCALEWKKFPHTYMKILVFKRKLKHCWLEQMLYLFSLFTLTAELTSEFGFPSAPSLTFQLFIFFCKLCRVRLSFYIQKITELQSHLQVLIYPCTKLIYQCNKFTFPWKAK